MLLTNLKQTGFKLIKVTSTLLMLSAIGLELANLYLLQTGAQLPGHLPILLWVAHFVLTAHLIEGAIAAFYAPTRGQNSLIYGIYTFFVGTVALAELFEFDQP